MAGDPILIEVRETFSRPTFVPTGVENDGALLRKLPVPRLPRFEVVNAYRVVGIFLSLALYIDYHTRQEKILGVEFVRSSFTFVEMAWGAPVSSCVFADGNVVERVALGVDCCHSFQLVFGIAGIMTYPPGNPGMRQTDDLDTVYTEELIKQDRLPLFPRATGGDAHSERESLVGHSTLSCD
jgi:hypothetical protein